ncbi:MAG: hypothetical protein E4H01_13225, partial [Lysobacterales bacterium]
MSKQRKLRASVRRLLIATAALAMGVAGNAFAADSITFTAGSPGGGYFKAAAAFGEYIKSDIPGTSVTVIPGGGWANVERLDPASKAADVGVLENALASMAWEGTGPTGKKYDFRMLAAFRQPGAAQAIVLDSVGISTFEELKAKKLPIRITMFERHQLATGQALAILEAYGITAENIESWGGKIIFTSISEAMRMLADGQADMWFTGGSYFPHPQYVKLGAQHPFKLMPVSKEVAAAVGKKFGQDIMEVPVDVYADANGQNPA